MSEAVAVPRLTMVTAAVFEESLVRNRQTDRQTDCLNFFIVVSDFENKKEYCSLTAVIKWYSSRVPVTNSVVLGLVPEGRSGGGGVGVDWGRG